MTNVLDDDQASAAANASDGNSRTATAAVVGDGFDAFFAEQHDSIVRALSLALADDDLGRDAAAEGFARALQRWSRVANFDNAPGWVYRVGFNWAMSRRRKSRREVALSSGIDHAAAPRFESDTRLMPAMRQLSPEHRAVVVARYYLDWSEQEIANALAIRPGTVKSRLSRALAHLADDLGTA